MFDGFTEPQPKELKSSGLPLMLYALFSGSKRTLLLLHKQPTRRTPKVAINIILGVSLKKKEADPSHRALEASLLSSSPLGLIVNIVPIRGPTPG